MIDFVPTVLDFCGIPPPEGCDGLSLKPLIPGTDDYPADRTLIIQCPRGRPASKWRNPARSAGGEA
jgi:arylsulfatase A-like enzyme